MPVVTVPELGGGFPLNGSQQHRQQAAHMRPSLSPKKCILPFSATVYPARRGFRIRQSL